MFLKSLNLAAIAIAAGAFCGGAALSADNAMTPSNACTADMAKLCPGVEPHSDASRACMRQHRDAFSPACRSDMEARRKVMLDKIKAACNPEIAKFCAGGEEQGGPGHCLREHAADLSDGCKAALPQHQG